MALVVGKSRRAVFATMQALHKHIVGNTQVGPERHFMATPQVISICSVVIIEMSCYAPLFHLSKMLSC